AVASAGNEPSGDAPSIAEFVRGRKDSVVGFEEKFAGLRAETGAGLRLPGRDVDDARLGRAAVGRHTLFRRRLFRIAFCLRGDALHRPAFLPDADFAGRSLVARVV